MKLLVASFFPAFQPPRSGGEQRYFSLYRHLSGTFDITLLSTTYSHHAEEVITFSPTLREHRVPKDPLCDRLHWQLAQAGIGPECSGYVVALAGARDTAFGRRFAELAADVDLIVHESPFTLPYDRGFPGDGVPRVYNAYNVEYRLAAQTMQGAAGQTAVAFIRDLELALARRAALLLVTSEEEREIFRTEFGVPDARLAFAPNGFEPGPDRPASDTDAANPPDGSYAVFMGSAHPPNVEAARHIVEALAPAFPALEFRVLGAVGDHLPATLPPNVRRLGFVDEDEKRRTLAGAAAALNPLRAGAGTNLKMLDYMAAGAPIVTTPLGARGLDLRHGLDAFVAGLDVFADALRDVLDHPSMARAAGDAAKRRAFDEYTWERIASRVAPALLAATGEAGNAGNGRPRVLWLNDYPVDAGTGGGHVRIRELTAEIGRDFDVTLLVLGDGREVRSVPLAPGVVQIVVPKTAAHRSAETEAGRGARVSVADLLAADHCLGNAPLVRNFRREARRAACVIFEHPYLGPLAEHVPGHVPIVYGAQNVETDLKAALRGRRPDAEHWIARTAGLERRLRERSALTIAVSEEDRARFRSLRPEGRCIVVPNGKRLAPAVRSTASSMEVADEGPCLAVFLGSAHLPNIEAARFLIGDVAPAAPEVSFALIGSVCDAVRMMAMPGNVALLGVVTEDEKAAVLARASLAVNPMFEGGGSSVKVPDFLGAGLPLVSTRLGVRGYALVPGEHYVEADRDGFASTVRELAGDRKRRADFARRGLHFARTSVDWRVAGRRYRAALRELAGVERPPRVLVATYRFADPPPGGAETFLANVVREMAAGGRLDIEVATCDVATIEDHWHFSAIYRASRRPPALPAYLTGLHRFEVDPRDPRTFEHCASLFTCWMQESRRQSDTALGEGVCALLCGGWNFPERDAAGIHRWASTDARIAVANACAAIRIAGHAPQAVHLALDVEGRTVATRDARGRFTFEVALPSVDASGGADAATSRRVSLRTDKAWTADGDPRELGVRIATVEIACNGAWIAVDLVEDFESRLRRTDPAAWVRSLIDLTERRDRAVDALFVDVRGPHSTAMRDWLEQHLADYDVVLVQGTPFATPVDVGEVAMRSGVPLVALPHFHMEDRYYHWRDYYDLFRDAQRVIAAPASVKQLFFDAIGADSVLVPGGGVDPREFEPERLAGAVRAFRALHPSATPFVLVLGRKTGAKDYGVVLDAIAAMNHAGRRVDAVLIGPDEDRVPVASPFVHAYGAQPREIALGALAQSLCLVTMSRSESFGIVLLESWLAGRPVIARSSCIAFSDLVVHGDNGFLADSVDDVVAGIERYAADARLAAAHAERGGALAREFTWGHIAMQFESILIAAARSALPDLERATHV